MRTEVSQYINKYEMLHEGDTVVVGVSGGADSVCLLFLLCEMTYMNLNIEVLHVNHGLRETAKRDADFVRALCEDFEKRFLTRIQFHLAEASVDMIAKENGLSIEEAGRMVRYDAMNRVLGNRRGVIAVAHHANDRAETMLFNMFRGSGLKGISGISPVNGRIIRPLLNVTRNEIEEFLNKEGLSYVTDETNLTDEYTRNKIRHNILDYAEDNISHGVVRNMCKAADMIALAEDYISEGTIKAALRCTLAKENDYIEINTDELLKEHPYIVDRLLYDALGYVAGKKKDITSEHIRQIRQLLDTTGSGKCDLPYGVKAKKEYSRLKIYIPKSIGDIKPEIPNIDMKVLEDFDINAIPRVNYTKWFDYDKISSVAVVRTREEGDYLLINSSMQKKSLKDYFINEKIPKDERNGILLLADGSHIMWVLGKRISEYYKVTENTKRVLEVSYGRADKNIDI